MGLTCAPSLLKLFKLLYKETWHLMLKLYAGISERDDMEKRQSFWLKHLIAFSLVIMNNWLWWSTVHNSFTLCMFYRETVLLASIFSGQFQCNLPMVNVLLNTAAFALYHLEIHFIISFQYFMNILVITVKAGWVFYLWRYIEKIFFVICHGSSIKKNLGWLKLLQTCSSTVPRGDSI